MQTIHVVLESPLAPERILESAYDFSTRRAAVWPAVSTPRLAIHNRGETWADITEGTRVGPLVNWERCRYDWSQPGSVKATVTDSNVYALPGSSWEMKAEPSSDGSTVEMTWLRTFKAGPRGIAFGTLFRLAGKRLFTRYAQHVLNNLEQLDGRRDTYSPPGRRAST